MGEEWIVRVGEDEYGPVDENTLREWRHEGRLIASNSVRKEGDSNWIRAAEIPGLFSELPPEPIEVERNELFRSRNLPQIITESFRIYARGFLQFFALALLVAIPAFFFKLSCSYIDVSQNVALSGKTMIASSIAVVMFVCVIVSWPIFIAGLQFATADLVAGRAIRLRDLLQRACGIWPRLARLCAAVYGAYIFWTLVPVLAILSLAAAATLFSLLLALVVLAFQVYMAGRLFINFMFWQQTSALGGLDGLEALRESRELARSRKGQTPSDRPIFRGALIASLWLLLLIALIAATEMPFLLIRLKGVTDPDTARQLLENLWNAPAPDGMTIVSYALSSLVQTALRPLLGIAFVLLYFDAKSTDAPRGR
ncbi:MAG: domain 2 [Verrucomicrobiota bacterium]|jgi:hypothetical protein